MRAACCEATVLRNEVIAPDIRLLTVVWPDRDHAPHAGQSLPCGPGVPTKPPSCPGPSACTAGTRTAAPSSFCIRWWARAPRSWHSSSSRMPSSSPAPWATALISRPWPNNTIRSLWWAAALAPPPCIRSPGNWQLQAAGPMCSRLPGYPLCMEEYRSIANVVKVIHRYRRSGLPRLCDPAV